MSEIRNFNINGEDVSINLASNAESGLMSSTSYNNLNKIKSIISDNESSNIDFIDSSGNVAFSVDCSGIYTSNIFLNDENNIQQIALLRDDDNINVIDLAGNIGFQIDSSGLVDFAGIGDNLKAKINELNNNDASSVSRWSGKKLLAIGDSITAPKTWQTRVADILGMTVRTHAKGGIGIIQMVDGDGSGDAPEDVDPDDYGTSIIYKLAAKDVADVDIIIAHGFYNERTSTYTESALGTIDDMYDSSTSTGNTFYGRLNYLVKRIYECLDEAGNYDCRVCLSAPHMYGVYSWNSLTGMDDGKPICESIKNVATLNSCFYIDCMSGTNINQYNWNIFQSSDTSVNDNYLPGDEMNDGTYKPFDSISEDSTTLISTTLSALASDYVNKLACVAGKEIMLNDNVFRVSSYYKSNGTIWELVNYHSAPWCADQLHLNTRGYNRLGDFIAGQIENII